MKRFRFLLPYLVYLAATAPFCDKAYDIDDALFVRMAEQIERDPLHPLAFDMVWDERISPQRQHPNPPLFAYWLTAGRALFGPSEAAAHLWLLPFGLLALWATGRLARRFGVAPLAAQLLLAASPALVLTSLTVMPDVMLLGLVAAGVAFGLDAADSGDLPPAWLAGLCLGAAALVRYNALGVTLLLALYPLAARKPWRHVLMVVALALLLPIAWNLFTYLVDGVPHLLATLGAERPESSARDLGVRALVMLLHIGGVALAPPVLAFAFARDQRLWQAVTPVALVLAGTLAIAYSVDELSNAAGVMLYPLFFIPGFLFFMFAVERLIQAVRNFRQRTLAQVQDLFLVAWLMGLAFAPVLYVHVAAKYLVPALPAVVLLFLRRFELSPRRLVPVAVVLGLCIAVPAAHVEYERAGIARRVAQEIVAPLSPQERRVWFNAEWGYPLYLEPLGAHPLHKQARLHPGDLVVATRVTPPHGFVEKLLPKWKLLSEHHFDGRSPLVTMNPENNAGFHSYFWGWLPFSFAPTPVRYEDVSVYEVTAFESATAVFSPFPANYSNSPKRQTAVPGAAKALAARSEATPP